MSGQGWRARAACRGADLDLFFPPDSGGTVQAREARAICGGCPVRAACLAAAEPWGIWGGVSERDRRRPRAAGASRFRGVTWKKPLGKWQARAVIGGRRVYLGVFADEADAARAVLEAAAFPAAAPSPQPRKAVA